MPDDWERKALAELEKGASVVTEALPRRSGHGLMRVMIPMKMEEECLQCHRDTLIPVGGLRGGATVSVDLNAYLAAQEPAWRTIQTWHGGIWLFGLAMIGVSHRVSKRRTRELARQHQTQRENAIAFAAMAEGAAITDPDGAILWVNDAFCNITGYTREEVIGANPRILKSGRHDEAFYRKMWDSLRDEGRWRGEIWNKRKTGEIYPEEISIQSMRNDSGGVWRYISIFSDISERKKSEQELADYREHLRELTRFLQDVRENERTSIARELHDEFGQALTALRIDLSWLRKHSGGAHDDFHSRLDTSRALVERTIESLRRISEGLRPGMLDVLGLAAALEHLVGQFEQRWRIACTFRADRDEYDLDKSQSIVVFRLVQEALTNVSRHARATEVDIDLREEDNRLRLVIQDDGVGFDTTQPRKGFGLLGMSERVRMLGGEIDIDGRRGTRIVVTLPLNKGVTA
jgi:PAS domain S-box-containing protein